MRGLYMLNLMLCSTTNVQRGQSKVMGKVENVKMIFMMNQYSLKNQGIAQKELTKIEKLDSTSAFRSFVATTTPSKSFAYAKILEHIMDPMIDHYLATYWLVYNFKSPSHISNVIHAFRFLQKVLSLGMGIIV